MPVPASTDASFRRYFRVAGRHSYVVMDAPPEQEVETAAFVNAAFRIPAGEANHRVDSAIEFVEDVEILVGDTHGATSAPLSAPNAGLFSYSVGLRPRF